MYTEATSFENEKKEESCSGTTEHEGALCHIRAKDAAVGCERGRLNPMPSGN